MLYSLYKDAYISQLVRAMDPALKDRTSFKHIKRAGALRGCRINNSQISNNGSHRIQWKDIFLRGTTDQGTQSSKLSALRNGLYGNLGRGNGDHGDEPASLISKSCAYGPGEVSV